MPMPLQRQMGEEHSISDASEAEDKPATSLFTRSAGVELQLLAPTL